MSRSDRDQEKGAQKDCEPSQEKVEVEAGGGEDGVDAVAVLPLEVVAVHPVVGLDLPDETLLFLVSSRYCDSDKLADFAWSRFGKLPGGGEGCGYAASLGQRKRVAHIPTAETEAARSSLILEGQRQARSNLKFNPSWSHEWGPVQSLL